jgi:hypothetical protein
MNNNQVSVSELDKMVRPKSIYVTSDLLPFDADASTATYGLQEPIMAQDGFDLVFGVRSFGFNASATNISYRQRNNTLLFEITYLPPIYVYTGDAFNLNPSRNTIESKTFKIIYPDGLYTIEELFYMLSNKENYNIPSGYLYDVRTPNSIINETNSWFPNDIFIYPNFVKRDGGFSVAPQFSNGYIINEYPYLEDPTNAQWVSAYLANKRLIRFKILPDTSSPELYNLLFTNKYSDSRDHAPEIPQFETNYQGNNPPISISFDTTVSLFDYDTSLNTKEASSTVSPSDSLTFTVYYEPDAEILMKLDSKYPALGFLSLNRPARFYHLPDINPLYVDVISDLPSNNVTIQGGQRGVLLRHFTLGGNNGGTSFYQSYDNPVFFKSSSSKENIDAIRLNFQSEGNKWHFFNLSFYLELLVFEYPKTPLQKPQLTQALNSSTTGNDYYLPREDEITSAMGPDHNSFPFRHLGNDHSRVYFQNSLDAKFKRPRQE